MSIRLILSYIVLFSSSMSLAVSRADLESRFGEDKQYQSLSDAKEYAVYGAKLLLKIYDDLEATKLELKNQIETEDFAEALVTVERMRSKVEEHEAIKGELNSEMQSIFQNHINPQIVGATSNADNIHFRKVGESFNTLYDITFVYFHTFPRKLNDITRHIMLFKDLQDLGSSIKQTSKVKLLQTISETFVQITEKAAELNTALGQIGHIN